MSAIPFTGALGLVRIARRTRLVRVVLGVALVLLVLATAYSARRPHSASQAGLPVHSGDLIVLDLSASVSQDTFSRIGETLRRLVAGGGRYGLVVFSGVAYEALPPGTPASALQPLVRYFTLPDRAAPGLAPTFPVNPWSASFSGGTRISAGLELARTLRIESHLRRASVVLVSDLADDPDDKNRLNQIVAAYRQEAIPLKVVSLNASQRDAEYFGHLTPTALKDGPAPAESTAPTPTGLAPGRSPFPLLLVLLVVAVAAAAAANELWSARLRWSAP
jgi:hypothetical protein